MTAVEAVVDIQVVSTFNQTITGKRWWLIAVGVWEARGSAPETNCFSSHFVACAVTAHHATPPPTFFIPKMTRSHLLKICKAVSLNSNPSGLWKAYEPSCNHLINEERFMQPVANLELYLQFKAWMLLCPFFMHHFYRLTGRQIWTDWLKAIFKVPCFLHFPFVQVMEHLRQQ